MVHIRQVVVMVMGMVRVSVCMCVCVSTSFTVPQAMACLYIRQQICPLIFAAALNQLGLLFFACF